MSTSTDAHRSPLARARAPRRTARATGCVTPAPGAQQRALRLWPALAIALGLYLTLEGYRSFEGDQAYRLPLLIDRQDPGCYQADPFVRAFDAFNPHAGYLWVVDAASRVFGLGGALFVLFGATFVATGFGVARLAAAAWPRSTGHAGLVAFALLLMAKAGNIGTNHLFEPMLLDRLMALALGWNALAALVTDARWGWLLIPCLLRTAHVIHPAVGLQLAGLTGATLVACAVVPQWVGRARRDSLLSAFLLCGVFAPVVWGVRQQSAQLFAGMPTSAYLTIAAYVQSPQHMIPHLWRAPQWVAWFGYIALAATSRWGARGRGTPHENGADSGVFARRRILVLLVIALGGLAVATFAIEVLRHAQVTLFQPFRVATVVRGLCVVLFSDRVRALWQRGTLVDRARAGALAFGLLGDLTWVLAVTVELSSQCAARFLGERGSAWICALGWAGGFIYLANHDPQQGHIVLAAAIGAGLLAGVRWRALPTLPSTGRIARWVVAAWAVPVAAMAVAAFVPEPTRAWLEWLPRRVRVFERPVDDMERLAVWCRRNTPADAAFIGPPGPKTFRLWSRRALAFNRAASPYHAAGLADWANRFCDHVGLPHSWERLAAAYLRDRHALERGYDRMTDAEIAQLAAAQGAAYAIVASSRRLDAGGALVPIHREGRWMVCRAAHTFDAPSSER